MGRFTIQEVIEHCERHVKGIERNLEMYRNWLELEPMPISVKRYWEHKQTAEWLKELQHYKDLEEQGYKMVNTDKVVEQLLKNAYKVTEKNTNLEHAVIGLIDVIKIVKGGGIDGNL